MRSNRNVTGLTGFGIVGFIIIAILGIGYAVWYNVGTQETKANCVIDSKDRSTNKDGASIYRVYTSCGVYTVEDSIIQGKFNAADTYAALKQGETYTIKSVGYRNGFLSQFPNILSATQ